MVAGRLPRAVRRTHRHHDALAAVGVAALPYRIEQELWRIGQEALVNVERHADATEVVVRWEVHDGVARLEVDRRRDGLRARRRRRRPLRPRGHAGTCRCHRRAARDREPARAGARRSQSSWYCSGNTSSERRTSGDTRDTRGPS